MLTSGALISRGRTRGAAFTLLEMLVVLVLLSLIAGIGIPAVQAVLQGQAQREATRLAALIRTLRNEAVLTRTDFHLVISLQEGAYWVEERKDGRFQLRQEPSLLRKHLFPSGVTLTDVSILGGTAPRRDRPLTLTVDSSGFVDPFLLHFTANGDPYTLKVSGFRADMDLLPGYVRE